MNMKRLLLFVALAAALPAAAQVASVDQMKDLSQAAEAARALGEKLKPAAVDSEAVGALSDKLSAEGSRIEMEEGTLGNVLGRRTPPDPRGRFRTVQANLVEIPAEAIEPRTDSMVRDLVMRRYFSRLEAVSDDWDVDPKTGYGEVHEWHYVVSLDGKLLEVEHTIAPVAPVGPGDAEPSLDQARSYRMSPSDPDVQKRWKKLSQELLTLGRTVSA